MAQRLVTDQMGNEVRVPLHPKRIVSLVPSQTELLYDLGLGDRVVGITKFCIHPNSWYTSKKRIGGTKDVNIDTVTALKPDLIIGNKEENTLKDIKTLQKIAPVWMSDIYNLSDALAMIQQVGDLCSESATGEQLVRTITREFEALKPIVNKASVLYLIWKKPYMGVASDTFIHHILEGTLGLTNSLRNQNRYPEVDIVQHTNLDYLFLSTEPFPFKASHVKELQQQFPSTKIVLVDGEYFSWYGSRLKAAPAYFRKLLSELKKPF